MHILRRTIIGIVFILPFAAVTTVWGNDAQARKTFALPIAELKQVTAHWLEMMGYDFSDRELEMGITQFICTHDNQHSTITMKPLSALATEVTIRGQEKEINSLRLEEKLSAYINNYINPETRINEPPVSHSNIPEIVFSKSDAVVCIQSALDHLNTQMSGFIIDSEGTVICTTHDLRRFRKIKVVDDMGKEHDGEVIKFNTRLDLALIQTTIKPRAFISLSIGKQTVERGSPIFSIGCPANRSNTITVGAVNKPSVRANELAYWQVDMEILAGSSGSPVSDRQGELIGMIKGRHREDNSIGFLIPTERIFNFINEF